MYSNNYFSLITLHYFSNFKLILKVWKRLNAGTVPANKEYAAGTVPANKEYAAGTLPANKKYTAGTVPANKKYAAGTPNQT